MDKEIKMHIIFKNNTIKQASTTLILVLVFLNTSYAQEFKLAGINYLNYPNSEINEGSKNQETSFQEFGVFVNIPKKFKNNKTVMVNGFGYGFVEATMRNFQLLQTDEYKLKLQEFYYQLTLLHKWNNKWSLAVNLKPTIAADFEEKISTDDFTFQAAVIATKTLNDKFKIGAGVLSTTRFGSPRVLPAVTIQYHNNRHNLKGLLPINMKYTYSFLPNEQLKLGLMYTLNGANFNINDTQLPAIDKINYSRANFGILANYNITKILRVKAFGGISTQRTYNLVAIDETVNEFNSKAAPFFNVGLVLVAPKKK